MAYPPSAGAYAIYTKTEFFSNIDFAIKSFSSITKEATGSFGYLSNDTDEVSPIEVCFKVLKILFALIRLLKKNFLTDLRKRKYGAISIYL